MILPLLALLAFAPTDTVLRFPLATAEIGESSVGDRLSGIWAKVLPLEGPPAGFAQDVAVTPRAKWFAINSFAAGRDSLVYGVLIDSTATTLEVLVDRNGKFGLRGEVAITLHRPAPEEASAVSPRVQVGKGEAQRGVRFSVRSNGQLDWRPDDRWETVLRQGNGAISVRILPFEPGSWIPFLDHDNDGMHDKVLTPAQVLPLGGYYWAWELDATRREMVLTRTAREPVIAGYRAPAATAARDSAGPATELVPSGVPTLLVFCYVGCEGCKLAMPAIDSLLGNSALQGRRRVVVVANAVADGEKYRTEFGTRMRVVLGAAAWDTYAILPTPTFVEVDASGMIVWRDEGWSDAARERVVAFLSAANE
jgi:hypothetical protein